MDRGKDSLKLSSRRSIYCFLASTAILSLLLSYIACRALLPFRPPIREWKMSGAWVTAAGQPSFSGYFRKSFLIPAEIQNAWIAVSACDASEVFVNGSLRGFQSLSQPNRGFQYASSERGQHLNNFNIVPYANYPRDYQWDTYPNYRVPVFFDLTSVLKRGRNCVCIRVNARRAPVRLCVQGEVLLTTGARLSLDSGLDWKTALVPRQDVALSWTDELYNDLAWPATVAAPSPGPTYCSFAPELFSEPFRGKWIVPARKSSERSVWFFTRWNIKGHPDDAWVKLITNRQYSLYINGRKAEPPTLGPDELAVGDWIVHTSGAEGKQWWPNLLDSDDARSLFNTDSPLDTTQAKAGETITPKALLRDQQVAAFDAYNVGAMLRQGENEVAVRLIQPGSSLKWTPKLALEANAVSAIGRSTLLSTAAGWTAESRSDGNQLELLGVAETGQAIASLGPASRLQYLGYCYPSARKFWEWTLLGGAISLALTGIIVFFVSRRVALLECFFGERAIRASESRYLTVGTTIMALAGAVLACTLIADACFATRDEVIFFMTGRIWLLAVLACAIVALLAGSLLRAPRQSWPRIPTVVQTHGFKVALVAILILCAFLRGHELQYQPTDPDDWASLHAILSIADKGVPMLAEDVFYNRGPIYHYLVAGLVAVFGQNMWVFRLPSVIFAVGTAALIYLTGKTLLHSRLTGLAAATLFCLHPLLINVGHQIRFYQQQQFFSLLTVYCFCQGFVEGQQMKWRYLTLAALSGAVFSQEISVIIGFSLVASYVLFAERKPWTMEMRFLVVTACIVVFVVLDFALNQTICLTVVEGVPPRIEPALKLNLLYLTKFYWFFILPSGLHFGTTVFFFLGLPFVLSDRNRSLLSFTVTFFAGIILTTILITGSGVRFQYWLLPLYFLILVHGLMRFSKWVMKPAAICFHDHEPILRGALVSMSLATILVTWSPWKISGSYSTKILPDIDGAVAFLRRNMLPRDALAASSQTSAAIVELGRVDYDIEIPLAYDFVYRKNGRLLDRNTGAEVISNLDDLQEACARHERLWVVITRDFSFQSPGETIDWREPGARFDLFVRTNCELKYQTYLADVFLWDYSKGRLQNFQRTW